VGIENFSIEALKDAQVREMARKVIGKMDMEMAREQGFPAAAVDIRTVEGKIYSRQVDYPFGTVGNPMSLTDIVEKFRYCCGYSVNPISRKNQDEVIALIEGLEQVKDTGRIARLFG
jgi:2-methylcitrate dehydratase PrpD